MNTFMNLVKRSLVEERTRVGVGASEGVGALVGASLLPALNSQTGPWPASSSCSPIGLVGELTQGLRRAQDPGAIAIEI